MKAITKVLAPAALVFAAFSANAAGLIETSYPLDTPSLGQEQQYQSPSRAEVQRQGAEQLNVGGVTEIDYPAGLMPQADVPVQKLSRADVTRQAVAAQTLSATTLYY
jgi:hypothetical protein